VLLVQQTADRPIATEQPARSQRGRLARARRLALALIWLVTGIGILATGERESSFADLRQAVRAGDVTQVQVTEGLAPGEHGRADVQLRWRDHLVEWAAEDVERQPGAVEARLRALDPDLQIERVAPRHPGGSVGDWSVAGWVVLLGLVGTISLFVVLVASPQPWRATRWGWFWPMAAVPPVGIAAYLLLSGPTPGIPEPRDLGRRMRGGAGFALGFVLSIVEGFAVTAWF
jgi:hypothetical protein